MWHAETDSLQCWHTQLCLLTLLPYHFVFIIGAEKHAAWPPVELVIVEAGPADCWGVHDGSHLCEVVQQHFIKKGLIPVLWHAVMLATVLSFN